MDSSATSSPLFVLTLVVFSMSWTVPGCPLGRREGVTFSLGSGPELAGFQRPARHAMEDFRIPLGGYVKFFGDETRPYASSETLASMTAEERKEASITRK